MLSYLIIRALSWPIRFLSYRAIHRLGNWLGLFAYHLYPTFRKRALSNLAMAQALPLTPDEIRKTALEAMQNLMIVCLEYSKLAAEKEISNLVSCENPEVIQPGQGVIFFCGHQANWEILFLDGTSRWPGTAIGRPIKNKYLYQWILSIREKFGGKIIPPKMAIKEGLRTLKKGGFLGVVGDQAMPESGYCSLFLGRQAWTSPMPALLSYRTGCPILVATSRRENGRYIIRYHPFIWPDLQAPKESEIDRLMKQTLSLLEKTILESPGQWLWQHNRWKQQPPGKIKRKYRHDTLCVILPKSPVAALSILRELYPKEHLTLLIPEGTDPPSIDAEILTYATPKDKLREDYRFKFILDFTSDRKVKQHYLKLSALTVLSLTPTNPEALKRLLSYAD